MPCVHCQRPKLIRSRGMCYTCYDDEEIRKLYPKGERIYYEPTQEEVDQCVAEQMALPIPEWWEQETEKPDSSRTAVKPEHKVGVAVERGRGLRVRGS
jgi:hypothetical protein